MWVHAKYRNLGIARALVDAARSNMIFGYNVPVSNLAFSSPTESGIRFAKHYNAGEVGTQSLQLDAVEVLVYDCL